MPAVTVDPLFDLVIARSAVGVNVSVSLAELFDEFGSVVPFGAATVAVFVIEPVAVLATVALTKNVAVPPAARLTVVLMLILPLGAEQLDPADAVQVQEPMTRLLGIMSVTVAPVTALGPALATTIV